MKRAFLSEWTKFLRLGQLLGSWGTMVGFGILLAIMLVANAKDVTAVEQDPQGPPTIPIALLEPPSGVVFAFQATGQLLGIIALVVAAANVATEYTSGTLKVLLVREPRRPVLLAGKVVATWTFVIAGIALTLVGSVAASSVVAATRGIDMSSWWSADGWSALGQAFGNVTASAMVWSLLGTMLAVLFRSGFPAIGIGIAYPLVVEGLLSLVIPDVVKWMPGAVLGRLAAGDVAQAFESSATVSYEAAALLALAYAAVFALVSTVLLLRRDVT